MTFKPWNHRAKDLKRAATASFILAFLLVGIPTTTAARSRVQSPTPVSAVRPELTKIQEFIKELKVRLTDCDSIQAGTPASGALLKMCLLTLDHLHEKFTGVPRSHEAIISKLKEANRWNQKLDEEFYANAKKERVPTELITKVRQAGGLRAFLLSTGKSYNDMKSAFTRDINNLPDLRKQIGSDANLQYPVPPELARLLDLIKKIHEAVQQGLTTLCVVLPSLC